MIDRSAVLISLAPGIERHTASLHIWAIPHRHAGWRRDQRPQTFGVRGITTGIEEEEVQCRTKALDLEPRRLDTRFAEMAEHARADEAKYETDDRQHHQHLDERVAGL